MVRSWFILWYSWNHYRSPSRGNLCFQANWFCRYLHTAPNWQWKESLISDKHNGKSVAVELPTVQEYHVWFLFLFCVLSHVLRWNSGALPYLEDILFVSNSLTECETILDRILAHREWNYKTYPLKNKYFQEQVIYIVLSNGVFDMKRLYCIIKRCVYVEK